MTHQHVLNSHLAVQGRHWGAVRGWKRRERVTCCLVTCCLREHGSIFSQRRWVQTGAPGSAFPYQPDCLSPLLAAMETFCETVQFYLRHLEDSVYPVMTEDQFALKLFPMYRYFVTVWLRHHNPEV